MTTTQPSPQPVHGVQPVQEPASATPSPGEVGRHMAHTLDVELTQPLPILQRSMNGVSAPRVWALLRLAGEPVGALELDLPVEGLEPGRLEPGHLETLITTAHPGIAARIADARTQAGTSFSRAHEAYRPRAARCSVVVCTREHPESLRRCLESLTAQDHPDLVTWVVDNAPVSTATREVVESFHGRLDVRYAVEERPGLSRARNAALALPLEGDIVAWLDDDEVADPMWASELARAFDGRPEVVAASGVVVPAELATQAQLWFEQFGGHSKGRGFRAAEFSPATRSVQHPLFPLPPFGVGANMAFRISTLRAVGGFDEALGAGTLTQGSEDTKMFTDLLRRGGTSVYWPTALTRHYHRADLDGLERQMFGYGSGLTAFYLASVLERPSTALTLARLAPRALREVLGSSGIRSATIEADFPASLLAANRRGMLRGPWLYLRERAAQRRSRGAS